MKKAFLILLLPTLAHADRLGGLLSNAQVMLSTQAYTTVDNAGSALPTQQTLNMTGAGVSCVDNPGQSRTDCTVAGSGGGASTLAVTTGTITRFDTVASSPTAVINFDQSQFAASLQGSATAYISIQAGIASISGSYTVGSSVTIVLANCTANCTVTLPTALGISGKTYSVKMKNAPPVQVTVAGTGGQTIDGNSNAVLSVQNMSVDFQSDNANWQIE